MGSRAGFLLAAPLCLMMSACSATAMHADSACPVTRWPQSPFAPPVGWAENPPGKTSFWYGDPGLWTTLQQDCIWAQLAWGEKFWWWSEDFDARAELR